MPRNYKRKTNRALYPKEKLIEAVNAVKSGALSGHAASIHYGIPRATILNRVNNRKGLMSNTLGRATVLTHDLEKTLVKNLRIMEKFGFGLTRQELLVTVGQYVSENSIKNPFKNGIPGDDWFVAFKKRHNLSISMKPQVENARKNAWRPNVIYPYFDVLQKVMNKFQIHNKPSHIWNVDVTNFPKDCSTEVIGINGLNSPGTINTSGNNDITVLLGCSAHGEKIPPLIVHKSNLEDEFTIQEGYPGTAYISTYNGLMETPVFEAWFESIFLPSVEHKRPLLLIYDGPSTHVGINIIEKAREAQIIIIKIPPHSSDTLQPLNVVVKALKLKWNDAIVKWQGLNIGKIMTNNEFSEILGQLWAATDSSICIAGFTKAGVFPLNKKAFPEDRFNKELLEDWKQKIATDFDEDLFEVSYDNFGNSELGTSKQNDVTPALYVPAMAGENYESLLTEVTMPGSEMQSGDGYKNMFASVWLRTELRDHAEEVIDSEDEAGKEPVVIQEPIRKTLLPKTQTPEKRKNMKQLHCDHCEYTTTYKNCLDLHVLGHADTKDYRCKHCKYATKLPTSLQRHVKAKHTPDLENASTVNCELCDYRTVYKWNLRAHMRKHNEDKLYKCTQCEYVTAYKHNSQKHAKTHATGKNVVFKCDKCHFTTKHVGHITRHLAKIHNEITETAFRCAHCDFTTVTKWRLRIHLTRSELKDPSNCRNCSFVSSHSCAMKKHKRDEHFNTTFMKTTSNEPTEAIGEDPEELDHGFLQPVQKTTSKKKSKKRKDNDNVEKFNMSPDCVDWKSIKVLESADQNKPFQCTSCIYSSRFKASVQRHYQRHHTGEKVKPYQCLNCDFSTKTRDQIALHNKRSKSDTALTCNLCEFQTEFKCTFAVHQKSHYPFTCSKCSYKCKSKYDLTKHYNYAHLDGIWKCQYCNYRAARKDALMAHETVHTGYKPFACGLCSYTSLRKSLLNIHFRRFHSELRDDVVVVTKDKIDALKVVEESVESNLKGFVF